MRNIKSDLDAAKYVYEKLKEQNCKSQDENGECVYRGYDPNEIDRIKYHYGEDDYENFLWEVQRLPIVMCAAGHLIDDKYYDTAFEGNSVDGLDGDIIQAIQNSNPDWNWSDNTLQMVMGLQRIHDQVSFNKWESEFQLFFKQFIFNDNGAYVNAGE